VPDIRYVCLSDLHFGAENSILTCLAPGTVEADPHRPSEVMIALLDCLGALISANDGKQKPTLVLCGDILELALASDNVAAMVFDRFIERAFAPGGELFDHTIYYVPGNHDHHLWEGAREHQYARYVRSTPLDADLEIPWHTTRMFGEADAHAVNSELLLALVHRHPHLQHLKVQAVYPNLGVSRGGRSRCVVFHHGHYVEGLYRLMSDVKDMVFPERDTPDDVWDWEAENFAWIDFFWSTLGRSGQVGTDVGLVYACLQSDKAMKRLSANLAAGIASRLRGPKPVRWAEERAIRLLFSQAARRAGRLERIQPREPLSAKARAGLQLYLEGPLRNQLLTERDGSMPEEVVFVFGHTHKPFETRLTPDGYAHPVDIYNTGGWVVDTQTPAPLHGGSAILIDEELDVVALRLYNQTPDGSPSAVRLNQAGNASGPESPFYRRLSGLLDGGREPWASFASATAKVVRERHADMAVIIDKVLESSGSGSPPRQLRGADDRRPPGM
jgi:UDP-2,3-diacylglucosamine pyrophosphatase LpxH